MTSSEMIRELCEKKNVSIAELCRRIGQTPQNFNKKLQRGTVSFEEMAVIAEVLDVVYEQAFVLPDGERIEMKHMHGQDPALLRDEGGRRESFEN